MKQHVRTVFLGVAVCLMAAVGAQPQTPTQTFQLSGRVVGAAAKCVTYVALWQSDGFLKRPVQQIRIEPGAERVFHFAVPAGRWAVSAFEDRNSNGILDMGFFGPKEPNGFWRAFGAYRRPRFDDVASVVERDTLDVRITLK